VSSARVDAKRVVDVVAAAGLLVATAPLQAAAAAAVRLATGPPVLHRARRAGRGGEPFEMLKFRTMVVGAAAVGPGITSATDTRITPVGRVLRRTKLDELPQLWNVLRGDMSLVGPRPEDPRYVALYTPEQRRVLTVRPGITGPAAVEYRHEEDVLAAADDPETCYREVVMPAKLAIDLRYLEAVSLRRDLAVLVATARALLRRSGSRSAPTGGRPSIPGSSGAAGVARPWTGDPVGR
jgi:lipopolysaccharide/colanic/teichoic acid biosynthesis glycosyltransferase